MSIEQRLKELYAQAEFPRKDAFHPEAALLAELGGLDAIAASVPSLNAVSPDRIAPGSLVRFRCMVQDLLEPEFYMGCYQGIDGVWRTTKYADPMNPEAWPEHSEPRHELWERRAAHCIAPPGEAPWVGPAINGAGLRPRAPAEPAHPSGPRKRREREEGAEEEDDPMEDAPVSTSIQNSLKRPFAFGAEAPEPIQPPGTPGGKSGSEDVTTRELRVPGYRPQACMVLLYPDADRAARGNRDPLRVSEWVEVLGVMSIDPSLAALTFEQEQGAAPHDEILEAMAALPPTSRAPRIHALHVRPLDFLLGRPAAAPAELAASAPRLRQQCLEVLTAFLGGDELAAHYLLLQLLSRVHRRLDVVCIGRHTLNLSHCPADDARAAGRPPLPSSSLGMPAFERDKAMYDLTPSAFGRRFARLLQALLPGVAAVGMGMDGLNYTNWAPRKDFTRNRLVGGPLQLPQHTTLLVDETVLEGGTLGQVGITNVHNLQKLAGTASLTYDYEYSSLEMEVDTPVLVLSQGKSLLKCDTQVRLAPAHPLPTAPAAPLPTDALAPESLGALRYYLACCKGLECDDIE